MSSRTIDRWITFECCGNFRDLGGYFTGDGRITKWRRLFRSSTPQRMSAADVRVVRDELGIVTIIDLRSDVEVKAMGIAPFADGERVRHVHLSLNRPLDDPDDPPPPYGDHVGDNYLWKAHGEGAVVASVLRTLADDAVYPALFHCAAGMDRTGIIAALVLSLVGVPDDVIVEEYVLTGLTCAAVKPDQYEAIFNADQLKKVYEMGQGRRPEQIVFNPSPVSMQVYLAGIRDHYGSVRDYVARHGIGDDVVERLAENLLD